MDWLTFIAAVVSATAWPIAVLIIFLVIRKPLLELIPLLQRLRYGDIEIDFGSEVNDLLQDMRRVLPPVRQPAERSPLQDNLLELARISPRAVVLEAWVELERSAIEAARRHKLNLRSKEQRSPILVGNALVEAGLLDENQQEMFYRLRNLRNAAAHASEFAFDADSALEYAQVASRLAEYLQQA